VLEVQFLRNNVAEATSEGEQIASSGFEGEESNDETNAPDSAAVKLSRAQQAEIAQMVGDTMVSLGKISDAVAYYDRARRAESSAAVRKALLRKIADAKSVLRIQHENAARQPLLHEALEQDRVVRPQLLARAALAPKAAAAQAGAKSGGAKP
jgi:hypothetical protein